MCSFHLPHLGAVARSRIVGNGTFDLASSECRALCALCPGRLPGAQRRRIGHCYPSDNLRNFTTLTEFGVAENVYTAACDDVAPVSCAHAPRESCSHHQRSRVMERGRKTKAALQDVARKEAWPLWEGVCGANWKKTAPHIGRHCT